VAPSSGEKRGAQGDQAGNVSGACAADIDVHGSPWQELRIVPNMSASVIATHPHCCHALEGRSQGVADGERTTRYAAEADGAAGSAEAAVLFVNGDRGRHPPDRPVPARKRREAL
jgi:hypothetical protein